MKSRIVASCVACSAALASAGWFADLSSAPDRDHSLTEGLVANPLGGNPDVVVWDLQSFANYSPSGGYHAYALGTTSCNQGDVPLLWQSSTNLHPVIGQNMYRWKDGRFEQLGMGWLKHGFYALSLTDCGPCQATDGTTLGIDCSDPYTASRNGSQGGLGPKYQVNATTGYFPYPPANPSYSGSTARRCRVPSVDVLPSENPGAVYFMEGQYICPDDSPDDTGDASNNSSHRQLNMGSSGDISSFAGPTIQELPAIASWDDLDPEVDLHEIEIPGEGTIWFGSRVFDEGDGNFRYEYAIFNLNVDRSIGALRVPWSDGNPLNSSTHKAPEWHSGEQFSNTGWSMTTGGGEMVWSSEPFASNEMANAVRWGNLQNITIVTTAQPEAGTVTLDMFKPGDFPSLFVDTQVPGNSTVSINFPLGTPDALSPTDGTELVMEVTPLEVIPAPNTGKLHVTRADSTVEVFEMVESPSNRHSILFSEIECFEEVSYFFSVDTTSGDRIYWPGGGDTPPELDYQYAAKGLTEVQIPFNDDFESDQGWAVSGDASAGTWLRSSTLSGCTYGSPSGTANGSETAFLTDDSACNIDVDGGQTILTSPAMDASSPESRLHYTRWYDCIFGPVVGDDTFMVELSSDDGATWIVAEEIDSSNPEADGGWVNKVLRVADYVENTTTLRVRFTAQDAGNSSIVEAGVDSVFVRAELCEDVPPCPADFDNSGSVDFPDLLSLLSSWGDCIGCNTDLNDSGTVDFEDLLLVLSAFGTCP